MADLYFSEYVEGSSNNKALEIYNGTGAAIDLAAAGYAIDIYSNGSPTPIHTFNLTGTVANSDVFVFALNNGTNPAIIAQADQLDTNQFNWYNGDDAIVLRKNTTIIDVIGQIGVDPGTEWGTGLTSTQDNTLTRNRSVTAGDINPNDAFNPSAEWQGFLVNTFNGLGSYYAAPVLNNAGSVTLPAINEDIPDPNNIGTKLFDLISGLVTDVNNDPQGIAVTGVDNSNGIWQYSLDGGSNWTKFGAVSDTNATVLGWTTLYTSQVGTAPSSQRLTFANLSGAIQTVGSGATTLTSLANSNIYTGYTTSSFTLDRTKGYTINFSVKINTEDHSPASAQKNPSQDSIADRAGFSIIAISSDGQKGIEIGFWDNEIWVQDDGVTPGNGSIFTHTVNSAERYFGSTTTLKDYSLSVLGNNYTLYANGTQILSGLLRDYTAFVGSIDPYETPNFIFLGDDTTSASASFDLTRVAVQAAEPRIRFVPNADYNGTTPNITFRAWDGTDGIVSGTTGVNASVNGGTTPFSSASETATITVNPINDAPTFVAGGNQNAIAGSGLQTVAGWASKFNPGATESTQSVDSYIVNVTSNPGIFATPPTIDPLTGNLTYTPTATIGTATTATVQVQVKDNGGTANGGVDTSVVQTFQITVNPGTPTVSIQAIDADAAEAGANTGTYQITRTGNTTGNLTVKFAVSNNIASSGDYTLTDSNGNAIAISNGIATVTLLDGQPSFNITLSAVDDIQAEAAETLKLDLVADGAYAIASSQNTATVTIQQNDTVVINTNDSGEGSLRQAIINANAFSGTNTIGFQIGTGLQTITPLSALPTINNSVIIDGTTQPGFSGTPIIQLTGSGTGTGLTITAGDSTVRGLIINRFQDGIELSGGGNNVIAGNFIGTNAAGNAVAGNSRWGVFINGSSNNIIGGTTAGTRNIISGNSVGLFVTGSGNQIQGNYIGTDVTGNVDLGNSADGITIQGNNNIIGGTTTGARNVISGNNQNGVSISQVGSSGNQVLGNYIGTNAAGSADLGNTLNGVEIQYAPNNIIGGSTVGAGNVISGNNSNGIWITGNTATGTQVLGNYIGTNADGSSALGNTFRGVWLTDANDNTIGGTAAGTGNAIAFNGQQGVLVSSGIGNGILGNSIFSNTSLGIDLGNIGVTANDVGDGDTGANNLQNYPLLTAATANGVNTTVTGTFNSNPNATFRLEFFSNTALDGSGNGEGKTFLGFTNVTTDASGNGSFTANLATVALGNFITATAANSNNTSEFSPGVPVTTLVSINAIDATAAESGTDTGIYQITRTGTTGDLTVYLAVDGSSTAIASDYNLSSGGLSVVIPDGQSFVNVTLTAVDDTLPELAETLRLNLATGAGYTIDAAKNNATVAIASNDTIQYAITTASPTLKEGDTGKQTVTFTVTRNGGIGVASTVDYAIGGTATSGTDYNNILVSGGGTALSGTINFAAGEATKTITLDVLGDTTFELNEDISVTLSNPNLTAAPESSTITTAIAQVTITNDDKPQISIDDVSVTEGNSDTTNATFTISLSNASSETVTVNYATSDSTATTVDGDYTSVTSTPITFNPGETTQTITVAIKGDNKFETNETFNVNLSGATNATIADNTGVGTITNDDNQPQISIDDVSITEGNDGTVNAIFTVSLSNPSSLPVSINYATANNTAIASSDYTTTNGTLTFNAGVTTQTISVPVVGELVSEANESFFVNLSNPINATIADNQGIGTIIDNDAAGFTISPISGNTTEAGGKATFTVKLNSAPTADVTIGLTSSDTTEGKVSASSLTFSANNWSIAQTVTVTGVDDAIADGNIPYSIITAPVVSTDSKYNNLNPNDVAVTNIDNDIAGFTITPARRLQTTEAGGQASFTVKLNSQPTANVTLGLVSSDTTEGISTSSLTFTPNNWNIAQTVTVTGVDDAVVDGNIAYKILTKPAVSADSKYNRLNPVNVAVRNADNDTAEFNVINGTSVSETLVGTTQSDRIYGFGGNDTISAGLGNDQIYGDDGNDTLIGDISNNLVAGGDDFIYGGTGSDRIYGNDGNDFLYGESGNDLIFGDSGNDLLRGGLGNDLVTGGTGRDTFVLARGEGTDIIQDFQIGSDFIGLAGGLSLGQLLITQRSSQTVITNNSNGEVLAALNNVNAATLQSYASSTFVTI
ncbi:MULTISPECIES: choice-of-anchor Y domain-containing protein [Cyanophyceae]|uniref:choice-of-anchor Y domain-containing protein n=1 Tax=Cyanophyceae TaxID=3028117 RepID=UPI00168798CD|nr:Calx-beta domain-containing protein [Trichocoleus sp. FACHB-40]MBD2005985.1 hypothetical protein [Trichocoleus sp. FACHB-40]